MGADEEQKGEPVPDGTLPSHQYPKIAYQGYTDPIFYELIRCERLHAVVPEKIESCTFTVCSGHLNDGFSNCQNCSNTYHNSCFE